VPDRSGIGALPLPCPDPLYDLPKRLWEFVSRIGSRFGGSRLGGGGFAKQRFDARIRAAPPNPGRGLGSVRIAARPGGLQGGPADAGPPS